MTAHPFRRPSPRDPTRSVSAVSRAEWIARATTEARTALADYVLGDVTPGRCHFLPRDDATRHPGLTPEILGLAGGKLLVHLGDRGVVLFTGGPVGALGRGLAWLGSPSTELTYAVHKAPNAEGGMGRFVREAAVLADDLCAELGRHAEDVLIQARWPLHAVLEMAFCLATYGTWERPDGEIQDPDYRTFDYVGLPGFDVLTTLTPAALDAFRTEGPRRFAGSPGCTITFTEEPSVLAEKLRAYAAHLLQREFSVRPHLRPWREALTALDHGTELETILRTMYEARVGSKALTGLGKVPEPDVIWAYEILRRGYAESLLHPGFHAP